MKDDHQLLIAAGIMVTGSFISYVFTKDVTLGVLIGMCVFFALWVIILLFSNKKEKDEQSNEEIKTNFELLEKLEKVGIKNCDLSIEKGITTENGLADVKERFCAMVTAGTKFTGADNFISVMKRCGVRDRDNVRFLLAHPDSEEIKKRSGARGMPEDSIGNLIRDNLKILKSYKNYLHVKFYPKWYIPWIRLFFVDGGYVLFSFYILGKTGKKSPQLKIIKIDNIDRSFYVPFEEIFKMLWEQGEEVNWELY